MPKKYTARKRRNAVDLYRRRNASRDPRTHMTLEQVAKLKRISSRTLRRWLDEDDRERERQTLAGIAGPPPLGSSHARIHPVIQALYRIAEITPCADCDGTGVLPGLMHGPCQHCDGTGVVPVLTARQAATQAALALNALEETTHAND